jgi:hypothetical protein
MEITRTTYSAADGPAIEKPFKLDVDNLAAAISKAIDYAKQPNPENFDACSLVIQQGNVFWITGRCYRNTVFSRFLQKVPQMTLTVPADAIPAQAWPFEVMEFCGYYGIRISTAEWTTPEGKPRVPVWDTVDPLHGL